MILFYTSAQNVLLLLEYKISNCDTKHVYPLPPVESKLVIKRGYHI